MVRKFGVCNSVLWHKLLFTALSADRFELRRAAHWSCVPSVCPGTGGCELWFPLGIISVVAEGELLVPMGCGKGLQLKLATVGIEGGKNVRGESCRREKAQKCPLSTGPWDMHLWNSERFYPNLICLGLLPVAAPCVPKCPGADTWLPTTEYCTDSSESCLLTWFWNYTWSYILLF